MLARWNTASTGRAQACSRKAGSAMLPAHCTTRGSGCGAAQRTSSRVRRVTGWAPKPSDSRRCTRAWPTKPSLPVTTTWLMASVLGARAEGQRGQEGQLAQAQQLQAGAGRRRVQPGLHGHGAEALALDDQLVAHAVDGLDVHQLFVGRAAQDHAVLLGRAPALWWKYGATPCRSPRIMLLGLERSRSTGLTMVRAMMLSLVRFLTNFR